MDVGHPMLRPQVSAVAVTLLQAPDGQHVLLARTRSMRPHMLNCISVRMEVCEGVAEVRRSHPPPLLPPTLPHLCHRNASA